MPSLATANAPPGFGYEQRLVMRDAVQDAAVVVGVADDEVPMALARTAGASNRAIRAQKGVIFMVATVVEEKRLLETHKKNVRKHHHLSIHLGRQRKEKENENHQTQLGQQNCLTTRGRCRVGG